MRPDLASREGGFTLLEVMVAFIIAALATGALLQGVGGGLQSTRVAAHTQEAVSRARSRLAALSSAPLQPGEQRGDDGGGFTWLTRVTLITVPGKRALEQERTTNAVLYSLTIRVGWTMDGGAREVSIGTQRLADAALGSP